MQTFIRLFLVVTLGLVFLVGCSKTLEGAKSDSSKVWEKTKDGTVKAWDSTKEAVHKATE